MDGNPDHNYRFQTLDRTRAFPYAPGEYARRFLWALVQSTLYRIPLPRSYRWRCVLLRLFGAKLHAPCAVHATTRVVHPWLLEMGQYSNLSANVTVYNLGMVRIGAHTVVSQDAYLCAGTHDHTKPDLPLVRSTITIGDGVWVAAGAFVGPDVTIGDNSVIGARAVVTNDIPAGVIAAGNPCRVIKPRQMKPAT